MVLACLVDVHDPELVEQVLYLHDAYSKNNPNVAANYVKTLGRTSQVRTVLLSHSRIATGKTVYEFIRDRLNAETFTTYAEITKGCSERERKRISSALCYMMQRFEVERIGTHRFYSFRLTN